MSDTRQFETLADIPRHFAGVQPEAIALHFEGRDTSYAAFDRHTSQVANALIAAGVKHGERICYLGKNSDHYFELFFGAIKMGAVMTPLNWRLAPPELAYIVNDSAAPILFVGPEFTGAAKQILAETPKVRTVVALEGGVGEWTSYEKWRDALPARDPMVKLSSKDVAVQLYTSGTTGRPKGAMLTHHNLTGMRKAMSQSDELPWNKWTAEDVSLVAMPVSHIGGTGYGLMGLYWGAKGIVAREFDPTKVLDFIEKDRVTKLFLVPAAIQIVLRDPRARTTDYSRLKYLLYGASPIPLELLREGLEVFGCGFVQTYGMTETTGAIVALGPEDHSVEGGPRMRSAGKALPGVEICVLDEAGNRLKPGEVGEIATRSIANMAGYWNLAEATAKTIDKDGWLRTGDAGYLDEDGYVYIHDRVKDMIISGGENIYPAEVENAIFGHPHVADVAVIGVPDEKWGEAVKAMVVAKPGTTPDPDDIIAWARQRIAGYKSPKSVDFIPALPRNASGKILRRELREPFWAGKTRRVN
ncbi:MAG: fatty acid--CoA ligase [Proteobacteria bacterium]|nr:fatty acid--CoA ligase [Pseudomonadota bacterium]